MSCLLFTTVIPGTCFYVTGCVLQTGKQHTKPRQHGETAHKETRSNDHSHRCGTAASNHWLLTILVPEQVTHTAGWEKR